MASSSCECKNGNKLSDLEKAELSLQLAGLVMKKILPIEEFQAIANSVLAFPDMAVKFVDALEKSEGDSFAYADFAEAAGALVSLVAEGAKVIGRVNPLYNVGDTILKLAFLANDLTDSNSPIRRLYDQLTDEYKEPLTLIGDENANQLTGGELCDVIKGGGGNDTLAGRGGNDYIYGEGGDDNLYGDDCNDYLEGGEGKDGLYGGSGDDILVGDDDNTEDILYGDIGFDTYVTGNNDFILDTLGQGKVLFEGIDLTGKKYKNSESGRYEDDDYVYNGDPKSKGPLFITSKDGSKSITIGDWINYDLGIELLDNKDIEVSITESASSSEGDSGKRSLSFTVTLSRALEDGEALDVSVSGTDEGSYIFKSGEQSKTFTYSWNGDTRDEGAIDHTATLTPSANYSGPSDDVNVTVKNSGTATIYDDDEDNRYDPLALDTNKDGFISTSDLETSGTYFDITGDGLRERVGWIKSEDAKVTSIKLNSYVTSQKKAA